MKRMMRMSKKNKNRRPANKAYNKPAAYKPPAESPITEEPKKEETVIKDHVIVEPVIHEPFIEKPTIDEPDVREPEIEETVTNQPDVPKKKKTLSLSIPGIILYSLLLIAIMFGTFIGVEKKLSKSPKAPDTTAIQEATPAPSEAPEAAPTPAETPVAEVPVEEEEEDWIDVSTIVKGEDHTIDYTVIFYEPNKRNAKLTWEDTVFSRIENPKNPSEAAISSYLMTRTWATREDGKKMEFESYTNPETNCIEKITAIEHCGDYIEVLDYYYDNGKINYIAQHQAIINTPVDITSADIVGRYYFNHDNLVKFSAVEDQTAYEYQVSKLNDYSSGAIKQYDYLEDTMINWAYITYKAVPALPQTEYIEGYVFDVYNSAMPDVDVSLVSASTGSVILTTKTNGDGLYSFEAPVTDEDTYTIQIKKQSLDDVYIYNIAAGSGSSAYYVKPAFMSYTQDGAIYHVQVSLKDASANGIGIGGAVLNIRKGLDNKDGEVYVMGTADALGTATVSLPAGTFTGELSKPGYETSYFPIIVEMAQTTAYGYSIPELSDGQYRFVTSWNTSPLDIESLLFVDSSKETARSTIDSSDNTKAEIISIDHPGMGTNRFFLYDYTNCTGGDVMSYAMSTANTLVTVFGPDGYMTSFSVPVGHGGVIWDVCRLQNGKVTSIGDYYTVYQPDSYWTTK